ncbi:hypothetical protein Agub_g1392, partial [Astrephomene gubernaculifera]
GSSGGGAAHPQTQSFSWLPSQQQVPGCGSQVLTGAYSQIADPQWRWQQGQQQSQWQQGGQQRGMGGAVRPRQCGVAVLSGPAGCGKSACVRVLAEAAGFEVVEWTPPPPVLWHEYQYQRSAPGGGDSSGPQSSAYQSKLDDFESFVSRSKYPSLALTSSSSAAAAVQSSQLAGSQLSRPVTNNATAGSLAPGPSTSGAGPGPPPSAPIGCPSRPKLLLLEDLPHTHDPERRQRLAAALKDLVACARG